MFDFGLGQMILLGAIALIAIGPKQLPEVAKTLGRFVGELKKYSGELTRQVILARDSTNQQLLNQQSHPPAGVTPAPSIAATVVPGSSAAMANLAHDAPLHSLFVEYDHDPAQLSFEFTEFIECYPTSWHSSNHHES